jgi:HSP20 family protein
MIMATETTSTKGAQGAAGHTPEPGQQEQQGSQEQGGQQQGRQATAQGGQALQGSERSSRRGGAVQQQRGQQGVVRASRNPLGMMQELSHEMDRLFESFFYGTPARGQAQAPALWVPQVEMREEGDKLRVSVDLPGVGKERVRVDIEDGALIVQGERRDERSEADEQQGFRRTERIYGAFYRAIPLPDGVDVEHAQAEMKDGVLEITLPLARQETGRRLEIKS